MDANQQNPQKKGMDHCYPMLYEFIHNTHTHTLFAANADLILFLLYRYIYDLVSTYNILHSF